MKDKKVVILIILGICALISLSYGILSLPKGRRQAPPVSEAVSWAEKIKPAEGADGAHRRAARTKFKSWVKHPFAPKGGPASVRLVLSGIVGSAKNPKAMIGDVIVGVGDKVGQYKVVAVGKNRVILNDGAKDIELKLKQ
ncbi:MAG: hypothetical protein Q8N91_02330 [Candidatus Omnitrophota bacterium]|nr:hypothetical protein [Candidatus Omnitrophota bacterium]